MLKDLLIVIDNSPLAEPFLRSALAFAADADAAAGVAMLSPGPLAAAAFAPLGALYIPEAQLLAEETRRLAEIQALIDNDRRPVELYGVRDDVAWISHDLRRRHPLADLIVIGTTSAWEIDWLRRRVAETLLLTTGTPLLLLPADHTFGPIRKAVLGWKPSREAARALHDLITLAEPGARIEIVMVDADEGAEANDVIRHLKRHGFEAVVETTRSADWSDVASMLQHKAVRSGADLLSVGGYAHSRLREIVLGGVTRDLLGDARLPVLLSH